MIRYYITILFCITLLVQAKAQEPSIAEEGRMYDDRILEKSSTTATEDIIEVEAYSKKYENFGKEVQGDTSINFNAFELSTDSINAWKNNKNYEWIKTIENDLKQNLENEEGGTGTGNRNKNNRKIGESKEDEGEWKTRKRNSSGSSGSSSFFNSGILKVILWALAGIFIFFVVYNLFLNKGNFGKKSKQQAVKIEEEVVDENDMETDFADLQRKAYNAGDTRLAMRYMFLKMLQNLQQKNYIQFVADKTNAAYATELPVGFKNDFAALAMYFEYVWYGKLDIEKDVFDKIEIKYNQFLNRI